jgi:hypothetical protein
VGQQGQDLVVITANHVVRTDDLMVEDKAPKITFFQSQGYQAIGALQNVWLPREAGDLTIVLVPKPEFVSFETRVLWTGLPQRGLSVWLIGRQQGWSIPTLPGKVSELDEFRQAVKVENLTTMEGSSGGPLISEFGIIGMIVRSEGLFVEATLIGPIARKVGEWNYSWQLQPETIIVPLFSRPPGSREYSVPVGPLREAPSSQSATRSAADPRQILAAVIQQLQAGTPNPTWYGVQLWQTSTCSWLSSDK